MNKILYCLITLFVVYMQNVNAQNNKDTLYVMYEYDSHTYRIEKLYPVPILIKTSIDSLINQDVNLDIYLELEKNEQNDSISIKEIKSLYFNIKEGEITGIFRDGILCSTKNYDKKELIQKFYSDVEYFLNDIINTHVIISDYPINSFYYFTISCKFISQ